MTFIKKLNFTADVDKVNADLDFVLTQAEWEPLHQIGITSRPNAKNKWKDAAGGLFNRETKERVAVESDFYEWNINGYTKDIIQQLEQAENFKCGRVRFMYLLPKCGLSLHIDHEQRYHLALKTNPTAFIACNVEERNELGHYFHIPADGHFYKVDTTVPHFVYNAGNEPRIHLVICES